MGSPKIADEICNFNRHYAERGGYWERSTSFLRDEEQTDGEITFYDSNSGAPLFFAPRGRSYEQFVRESKGHGWPSFRDDEVNWERVRVLPDGETVSIDGTHLDITCPIGMGTGTALIWSRSPGSQRRASSKGRSHWSVSLGGSKLEARRRLDF